MAPPKGHKKYSNCYKPKLYEPDNLWIAAMKYFSWSNKRPIKQEISHVKLGTVIVKHKRAYSIERLCLKLKMSKQTFLNYEKNEMYFDVCTRIRDVINSQHFEGGMVNIFNSNIVTRKLGLAEKTELSTNSEGFTLKIGENTFHL
jgi:hypothetical protein